MEVSQQHGSCCQRFPRGSQEVQEGVGPGQEVSGLSLGTSRVFLHAKSIHGVYSWGVFMWE